MCQFLGKTDNFECFGTNLNLDQMEWENRIRVGNSKKLMSEWKSASSKYLVCQFSGKTDIFYFFGPNLPKNWFWGWNFKNLSQDSECTFYAKMDNFRFFDLNLGKLPNYMRYFASNNVESVAESWVELDGAELLWMELGGGGCTVYQYPFKNYPLIFA